MPEKFGRRTDSLTRQGSVPKGFAPVAGGDIERTSEGQESSAEPDDSADYLIVRTAADADRLMDHMLVAAGKTQAWVAAQSDDPLGMLRRMKFEPVGYHPIAGHSLNLVEQINQTWTFAVAVAAARQLLHMHPEAGGFRLAPGARASLALDIMSEAEGLVGAETFAAVTPSNNGKLAADLSKLSARQEVHRYLFFMSPGYPGNRRWPRFEREGIQVWSVDI